MRILTSLRGLALPALLLTSSLSISGVAAKKDKPSIKATEFKSEPYSITYFDDTETVLLYEASGKLWRSENAGADWEHVDTDDKKIEGIFKHPYDNKVAIAMGRKAHWITYNQGKEWRKFETPQYPSMMGGVPFGYHAADSKKILFHGLEDECPNFNCFGAVW
jgi:photosystem II stability/assembly factor-like uncharacterized protein